MPNPPELDIIEKDKNKENNPDNEDKNDSSSTNSNPDYRQTLFDYKKFNNKNNNKMISSSKKHNKISNKRLAINEQIYQEVIGYKKL